MGGWGGCHKGWGWGDSGVQTVSTGIPMNNTRVVQTGNGGLPPPAAGLVKRRRHHSRMRTKRFGGPCFLVTCKRCKYYT